MPKAIGIVNLILKTVTDTYLRQVAVQQHMNEIYYPERNKLLFKNAPTHSNQPLAAPLKCFCAKLLSDCKELDPEIFFLYYFMIFTGLAREDIWRFMYTFSNICKDLTALGIKNALQSIESLIQVRFLYVPPC